MAAPSYLRTEIWSDLACFSGVRQGFVRDILSLAETRTTDNADQLTLVVGRTNAQLAKLVKLAVLRILFSDGSFDEWRITGIEQDQVSGKYTVTCDWPLIDLSTRALPCSTPTKTTDDQAPYSFEGPGLTPAEHWDNYISRGFPAAWSGKVTRGTFDILTPQTLVYDWDKPRKIIGDLAQLTDTEIQYRRVGTASYALDLLTAIGATAPVLDVRLGKQLAGVTVKEDENKRATTVLARGALVDGVSYGIGQNRWEVSALNAGAKTMDLIDPAGRAGPIAFDHQFGTTGLAYTVFNAKAGVPDSTKKLAITDSAAATQRLTFASDPTALFAVGDSICIGDVDGSGNYAPIWKLNDGPQAISDPPVQVLKRDDVVAGINLVKNPLMRTWTGLSSVPPDGWFAFFGTTITRRTLSDQYLSGGKACRVQTSSENHGLRTNTILVTPTGSNDYFVATVTFRIDALTGGARVALRLLAFDSVGGGTVELPDVTVKPADRPAADKIGQWVTVILGWHLTGLNDQVGPPFTADQVYLLLTQEGPGTADFTVDSAQLTQTSMELPLLDGASGNILWQASNELIAAQRVAQREYQVDVLDLAASDPTTYPFDQLFLGQSWRVTDPDVGLSTPATLRVLSLSRDHITDGAPSPAKVRVVVGVPQKKASDLFTASPLSSRQATAPGIVSSATRYGATPAAPVDTAPAEVPLSRAGLLTAGDNLAKIQGFLDQLSAVGSARVGVHAVSLQIGGGGGETSLRLYPHPSNGYTKYGRLHLHGAGSSLRTTLFNDAAGTRLVHDDGMAAPLIEAINGTGLVQNDIGDLLIGDFRLDGGLLTTYLIDIRKATHLTELERLWLFLTNPAGGGIQFLDSWEYEINHISIRGQASGAGTWTGIGIHLYNQSSGGTLNQTILRNCQIRQVGCALEIGVRSGTNATVHGPIIMIGGQCSSCDAEGNFNGLGARGVSFLGVHFENNQLQGSVSQKGARHIRYEGCTFNDNGRSSPGTIFNLDIGGSDRTASNVTVDGAEFTNCVCGILVRVGGNMGPVILDNLLFVPKVTLSGTAAAGSTLGTIKWAGGGLTVNAHAGYGIIATSGAHQGQYCRILSNTATDIVLDTTDLRNPFTGALTAGDGLNIGGKTAISVEATTDFGSNIQLGSAIDFGAKVTAVFGTEIDDPNNNISRPVLVTRTLVLSGTESSVDVRNRSIIVLQYPAPQRLDNLINGTQGQEVDFYFSNGNGSLGHGTGAAGSMMWFPDTLADYAPGLSGGGYPRWVRMKLNLALGKWIPMVSFVATPTPDIVGAYPAELGYAGI